MNVVKKFTISPRAAIAIQDFKKEAKFMTESEIVDYCVRATFLNDRKARITLEEVRKLHFADLEIE